MTKHSDAKATELTGHAVEYSKAVRYATKHSMHLKRIF